MEKKCLYCGKEIQGGAIMCKYCGKNQSTLVKNDTDEKLQGISMRTIPQIIKVRKPLLGGIGIALLVIGLGILVFGAGSVGFPLWLILMFTVGLILLVSALITGNIKVTG